MRALPRATLRMMALALHQRLPVRHPRSAIRAAYITAQLHHNPAAATLPGMHERLSLRTCLLFAVPASLVHVADSCKRQGSRWRSPSNNPLCLDAVEDDEVEGPAPSDPDDDAAGPTGASAGRHALLCALHCSMLPHFLSMSVTPLLCGSSETAQYETRCDSSWSPERSVSVRLQSRMTRPRRLRLMSESRTFCCRVSSAHPMPALLPWGCQHMF